MARERVGVFSQVGPTIEMLDRGGILLVSQDGDGRPNAMTIGWGTIGWIWGGPIFTVLVRPSRYTDGCIRASGEFTIAVLPATETKTLAYCGTHSGRDLDKLAACGLSCQPAQHTRTPVLAQAAIAYECQVVHVTDVHADSLAASITSSYYPAGDYHHVYHGKILAVTAEPNAAELLA